jgi:hypothetical protein
VEVPISVTTTLVYNETIFLGPFDDVITEFYCISEATAVSLNTFNSILKEHEQIKHGERVFHAS